MKITTTTDTRLTAIDHGYSQLIVAPVMAVIGIILIFAGVGSHTTAAYIFGGIFILIGAALVLTRKSRTLVIDKGAGTLVLTAKGVTGGNTYNCNLQDIVKLQLVSEYQTQYTQSNNGAGGINFGTGGVGVGNTSTQQTTQLLVVQRDGTMMEVASGSRSMSTIATLSKVPNQEVGEQIASFVGVPFEVVGPNIPTLGSVVSEVQNAIQHHGISGDAPAAPTPATPPAPPAPATPSPQASGAAEPLAHDPNAPGYALPHVMPGTTPGVSPAPEETQPPQNPLGQ